mmetsp:Transcript_13264/g.23788  ORF Transcript_13264/g.23788 Transcript_13264/m.23788 type:complete len:87 (-) Transcript_13264:105-365(-)
MPRFGRFLLKSLSRELESDSESAKATDEKTATLSSATKTDNQYTPFMFPIPRTTRCNQENRSSSTRDLRLSVVPLFLQSKTLQAHK